MMMTAKWKKEKFQGVVLVNRALLTRGSRESSTEQNDLEVAERSNYIFAGAHTKGGGVLSSF